MENEQFAFFMVVLVFCGWLVASTYSAATLASAESSGRVAGESLGAATGAALAAENGRAAGDVLGSATRRSLVEE